MRSISAAAFLLFLASCTAAPSATVATTRPFAQGWLSSKYVFDHSKIFPGTTRNYQIYVPAEYDPAKPACLFVDQDSVQFNAPAVFDRLIAQGKMPITIAVFVSPGIVPAPKIDALKRFNRSYEFDSLGDNYVRFLLEELLPEVETRSTPDGRAIHLSHDANDRAIGGSSSGAMAAFTCAWERPDSFSRVFSAIGSYTNLRGGNVYPLLIRKFEPKPIRIFLQDGSADHNHYAGDWWMANQEMERALTYTGYEVNHIWGTGDHDHIQANQIFPDAMVWLWHDYPTRVKAGLGSEQLQQILIPGEGWHAITTKFKSTDGPAADGSGNVLVSDGQAATTYKIAPDGTATSFIADGVKRGGECLGPDGLLYATASGDKVVAYDAGGKLVKTVAEGIHGNDLVVTATGGIYVTTSGPNTYYIDSKGARVVDTGLKFTNGIAVSPDQTLLYVGDYRSHWVYNYQIQPDGSLADKQKFYDLYVPDWADDAADDGMRVDRDGRLYVTTRVGIQVCDQAGRVICIIPTPNGKVSNLSFGGPDSDILYATCGDTVYFRKLKVKGAFSFQAPIVPAPPKL